MHLNLILATTNEEHLEKLGRIAELTNQRQWVYALFQ